MKTNINIFTLASLLFMLFLSLFRPIGFISYLLAALLTLALVIAFTRVGENGPALRDIAAAVRLKREGLRLTLLLAFPTVLIIFAVSYLTSLLLGVFGAEPAAVPNAPLPNMLLEYALIPALSEEAVFRLLPLVLLAPYSKRWAIILSAAVFALVHCDFFQMPYAFVAGLLLMTLDVMTGSVIPSLLIHLINNAASVVWIKYCTEPVAVTVFLLALIIPAVISLVILCARLRRYLPALAEALSRGERELSPTPLLLAAVAVISAIYNL